jgi:hypothetical protein
MLYWHIQLYTYHFNFCDPYKKIYSPLSSGICCGLLCIIFTNDSATEFILAMYVFKYQNNVVNKPQQALLGIVSLSSGDCSVSFLKLKKGQISF